MGSIILILSSIINFLIIHNWYWTLSGRFYSHLTDFFFSVLCSGIEGYYIFFILKRIYRPINIKFNSNTLYNLIMRRIKLKLKKYKFVYRLLMVFFVNSYNFSFFLIFPCIGTVTFHVPNLITIGSREVPYWFWLRDKFNAKCTKNYA